MPFGAADFERDLYGETKGNQAQPLLISDQGRYVWRVLSQENMAVCRDMARLHERMGQEILAMAKASSITGEPLVRPLEYEYPHQGYASIKDQFLLGDKILVAPVLENDAHKRTVVFPQGTWQGDDGSKVTGPATVEIDVPLDRLPWYRLK